MKITLNTSLLFGTLLILEKETRYGITDQVKDLILIETSRNCVHFTASTKYSSLRRTFSVPESNFPETYLVGLKEFASVLREFVETTKVNLILSREHLKVEVENHPPVLIPCRNLDLWPHKTCSLSPIFRQPRSFNFWLNEAWRFVNCGDTVASQRAKIWLTSGGIIASREKAFLHIPFNCSIRTPVFLSPPPVFLMGFPEDLTYNISKGMVTGYEAIGRSVAIALESFSWSWIIYKPSECISERRPEVPKWMREAALCSIHMSDEVLQQCNEYVKRHQKDYLELDIRP